MTYETETENGFRYNVCLHVGVVVRHCLYRLLVLSAETCKGSGGEGIGGIC